MKTISVEGESFTTEGCRSEGPVRTSVRASIGVSARVNSTNAPAGDDKYAGALGALSSQVAFLQKRVSCPTCEAVPANIRAGAGGRSLPAATVRGGCDCSAVFRGVGDGTSNRAAGFSLPEHPERAMSRKNVTERADLTGATITRTIGAVAEPFAPHVADQRAALLGVLSSIGAEGWRAITVCDPWTVHDVVAHLVEGELRFGRLYRGEIDTLDADNEADVGRWAKVDAETVRYSLWHHGLATQRVIDSRSDESWNREVSHMGWPIDLRRALRMHFFELAVHAHDVTSALGVQPILDERAAPLADYCISLAPLALALLPPAGAVELDVGDVGIRTLEGAGRDWQLAGERSAAPTSIWHTDPETLILVVTGRLDVGEAIGRTKTEGDDAALRAILEAWQLAG